jgi:hypothetical protein
VTDTRQETGRKRWFTSGRTIATGAVAAVAVIAGLLTNIKTIVDWFELSRPADIHIRDLMVRATYPVNLYDFSHQAPRAAWARTIPPIDKGYVAQLYLRAEKRGGDAAEGCIVQEMHGAKPMWKWLEAEPPPNSTSEHDGQFYVLSDALAFTCLAACSSSPALTPTIAAFSLFFFSDGPKRLTSLAEPLSLQRRHQPHESRAPPS